MASMTVRKRYPDGTVRQWSRPNGRAPWVEVERYASYILVGGPRNGHVEARLTENGAPPTRLQYQWITGPADVLQGDEKYQIWFARYRRREAPGTDGVWRYDYDAEESIGTELLSAPPERETDD